MIPVAITIGDPSAALILLAGVYYGAIFGGSTSSILLNAPGVAGTVATSFDGYPMARRGQAGKALTVAAIASFAGGTIDPRASRHTSDPAHSPSGCRLAGREGPNVPGRSLFGRWWCTT